MFHENKKQETTEISTLDAPLNLYHTLTNPPEYNVSLDLRTNLKVLGPCPTAYKIVHLVPASTPSFYLEAECAENCLDMTCSRKGHTCQNVSVKLKVMMRGAANKMASINVNQGCVCTAPKQLAHTRPILDPSAHVV
ncbi:hypothetical protein AAG570_012983 [Ranatra chinensis]|uniref:Platelet-derived growth factor (PDGF) family profile domain-containing protein n=1 Tax=Ranatra chinensis TaxID=642074 RepID=A0ABD0YFH4_9HEMI